MTLPDFMLGLSFTLVMTFVASIILNEVYPNFWVHLSEPTIVEEHSKKECIVNLKITKLTNSYLITAINNEGETYTNDYILIDKEGNISITNAYENITVPITRTLE